MPSDEKNLVHEIDKISELCRGKINALYLSHFHADHYNGIKYLMNDMDVKVDDIIIPYFDDYEKIATLVEHHMDGIEITQDIFNFIMNPQEVFFALGFTRVIIIDRERDDEGIESSATSPDSGKPEDSRGPDDAERRDKGSSTDAVKIEPTWKPKLRTLAYRSDSEKMLEKVDSKMELSNATSTAIAEFDVSSLIGLWPCSKFVFVPHVRSINERELRRFRSEIENLRKRCGVTCLGEVIFEPGVLDKLGECYKNAWPKGQNSISMSLYVGPEMDHFCVNNLYNFCISFFSSRTDIRVHNFWARVCRLLLYWFRCFLIQWTDNISLECSSCGGWLLTGDSVLDNKKDYRDQFERRYRHYMPYVNVVMVPHHGSKHNVSSEFFDFFSNVDVYYVASNPDTGQHHPHKEVKKMIPKITPFHIVDTYPDSILEVSYDFMCWPSYQHRKNTILMKR